MELRDWKRTRTSSHLHLTALVGASSEEYQAQKKNAVKTFSHRNLVLDKGDVMASYIKRSIQNLKAHILDCESESTDIDSWIGNTVLDTHAKLTISQDFNTVENGATLHSINKTMHKATIIIQYCTQLFPRCDVFSVFGNLPPLGPAIANRMEVGERHNEAAVFVSYMINDQQDGVIDYNTIKKKAFVFILSGVETIPGYNPHYFVRDGREVRSAFQNADQITTSSTQDLAFLKVCLHETLRVSPPAVGTLPRRIPSTGAVVCGRFVPGGMTVGIHNWSTTHSKEFWKNADFFRPERWMGDPEYANDTRAAFHPFGFGPRMCVAQHLVVIEAGLILARLLFEFDMELDSARCENWHLHKGHFVPTSDSLFVKVKVCERFREN